MLGEPKARRPVCAAVGLTLPLSTAPPATPPPSLFVGVPASTRSAAAAADENDNDIRGGYKKAKKGGTKIKEDQLVLVEYFLELVRQQFGGL